VGSLHVLVRTRCATMVAGLTLCRMGDEVGYPNAVTYAEAGHLKMERCRVTCGGAATSVTLALHAFSGAPEPGQTWQQERSRSTPVHDPASQSPQSGVWVGAAACVEMRGCTIANCMGPGVKIYRGRLRAHGNTIAFSSRGANVVANGGHVVLEDNEIHGATGDGISSWNNSVMHIVRNRIHGNSGAGIAINSGAGSVNICHNAVFENACQPVLFATSSKQATVSDNDFQGGKVIGCSPNSGEALSVESMESADGIVRPSRQPASLGALLPAPPCISRMPSNRTLTASSSVTSSEASTPLMGPASSSSQLPSAPVSPRPLLPAWPRSSTP
jgi:hypothetical protein